jgi:hypothetical protein
VTSRAYPDVSCALVFEPREWHTIYTMQHHRHPPQAPPSLREMVRGLAQLGGFLARTGTASLVFKRSGRAINASMNSSMP